MKPRALFGLLVCVWLAVSAKEETASAPPSTPVEAKSDYSALSPAARLGIKFTPPAKVDDNTAAVPRVPFALFPELEARDPVVLAPFLVTAKRIKFTEAETLTEKGRLDRAMKQQLSPLYRKTFGPLTQLATYYFNWTSILGGWHPNEVEAMILHRQEQEIKNQVEMNRLLKLEAVDSAGASKLLERVRVDKPVNGVLIQLSN